MQTSNNGSGSGPGYFTTSMDAASQRSRKTILERQKRTPGRPLRQRDLAQRPPPEREENTILALLNAASELQRRRPPR